MGYRLTAFRLVGSTRVADPEAALGRDKVVFLCAKVYDSDMGACIGLRLRNREIDKIRRVESDSPTTVAWRCINDKKSPTLTPETVYKLGLSALNLQKVNFEFFLN